MRKIKKMNILRMMLFLIGVILLSSSNLSIEHLKINRIYKPILKESYMWTPSKLRWTRSCYLNAGDYVQVLILPPLLWGEDPYDTSAEYPSIPGYRGAKIVYVDYILNETHQTWFELWYYQEIKTGKLVVVNRSIYQGKNDCLTIKSKKMVNLNETGGIVKYSGNYTLRISGPFPPPYIPPGEHAQTAPVWIELNKINVVEEIEKKRLYHYLFIPGIIFVVSSAILWALTSKIKKKSTYKNLPRPLFKSNKVRYLLFTLHSSTSLSN